MLNYPKNLFIISKLFLMSRFFPIVVYEENERIK